MVKNILNRKRVNPSEPVFTGLKHSDELSLQLFKYNQNGHSEDKEYTAVKFTGIPEDDFIYWINIHGLHDIEQVRNICEKVGAHDLVIQDILDVNQRPKFQEFEKYFFFTMKSTLPSIDSAIEQEQLSFIIGDNYLISFQERVADHFDHIRERIRRDIGIVRERGSDYLLFLLLEAIMDNYFKTVDEIEGKIENLGLIGIESDPSPNTLREIERFKRQIHQIKKTIVPIKDFVVRIEREKFRFIQEKHIKYFLELKDLCLSLVDDCEQHEMRLESSTNLFFSVQGHRMNQVMKTLTIVATIFIPMTFVAGIYGMNFTNMPELNWKWGYLGVWLILLVILIGMVIYFKRKKWF